MVTKGALSECQIMDIGGVCDDSVYPFLKRFVS